MLAETLFWIPFSVIGRCSPVLNPHWLQGKCAKFILSQVAFVVIYRITSGFPYAFFRVKIVVLESLKRVTGFENY
jgi:hypothetical protein